MRKINKKVNSRAKNKKKSSSYYSQNKIEDEVQSNNDWPIISTKCSQFVIYDSVLD